MSMYEYPSAPPAAEGEALVSAAPAAEDVRLLVERLLDADPQMPEYVYVMFSESAAMLTRLSASEAAVREECAKICEQTNMHGAGVMATDLAERIRARTIIAQAIRASKASGKGGE